MPDYGHELRFGTFLTPDAQNPDQVVALAELTEAAGLDLTSFQDHPYNAEFLDTWTLLSWVAARTRRLRISGNVLSLPLRPPAVLARAAASLDRLSHGRFELGLGAGAFWDGIEGMGARRLTPGQGVEALREAIDVLRGVWDVTAPGPLRQDGKFYPVPGMRRGPEPAHDIDIWLGAYQPTLMMTARQLASVFAAAVPIALLQGQLVRRMPEEAGALAPTLPAGVGEPFVSAFRQVSAAGPDETVGEVVTAVRRSGASPEAVEAAGRAAHTVYTHSFAERLLRCGAGHADPGGQRAAARQIACADHVIAGVDRGERALLHQAASRGR
ncbi:LLM class flavin-dependent oxidoreductase [Streptomyces bauhiniae]